MTAFVWFPLWGQSQWVRSRAPQCLVLALAAQVFSTRVHASAVVRRGMNLVTVVLWRAWHTDCDSCQTTLAEAMGALAAATAAHGGRDGSFCLAAVIRRDVPAPDLLRRIGP